MEFILSFMGEHLIKKDGGWFCLLLSLEWYLFFLNFAPGMAKEFSIQPDPSKSRKQRICEMAVRLVADIHEVQMLMRSMPARERDLCLSATH